MAQQGPPPQPPPPSSTPMHASNSISGGSSASNNSSPAMQPMSGRGQNNWDGDRMLHIYMIDYCRKRNYTQVVSALCSQTSNLPDVKAPIDAPQGLLFEWWVVFWEIFTAKSNEVTSRDAVTYLQAQRVKTEMRGMGDVKPSLPGPQGPMPIGPGGNFMQPPPPHAAMNGLSAPFQPGPSPQQQQPQIPQPGGPHITHHPGQPNGIMPPVQHPPHQQQSVPPPGQHPNGPQPYPPQPQTPQQSHPGHPHPQAPQQPHLGLPNGAPGPQIRPQQTTAQMQQISAQQRAAAQAHAVNGIPGAPPQQQQGQPVLFQGSPMPGPGHPGANPAAPFPRISNMGPPTQLPNQHMQPSASTPGASGMNGIPHQNSHQTPTMGPQQPGHPFPPHFVPRPSSRSGTPGSQPGGQQLGMSPSGIGMPPGVQRPGAQIGGQQGQQLPFSMHHPAMAQAMQSVGLSGRPPESFTPDERNKLQQALRRIPVQHPGSGMGPSRIPSGGPPPGTQVQAKMPPPGGGQGSPGVQGGPSGPAYGQSPFNQPIMGTRGQSQTPNNLKRSGSPAPEAATAPQSSSPPSKRRRNDENGVPSSGYAPGAPNGMTGGQPPPQVPQPLTGQHPMMNGPGSMMRPPSGPGQPPQQINPMMIANGGQVQNAQLHQQQHMRNQQRYGPMLSSNKAGMMANPNPSGLPIPVPPGASGDNLTGDQQQGNNLMGGRKVLPSPSISAAKAPGLMPSSRTPNPLQGSKVKEEEAGSAKSSPANKAAPPPPNATSATPMPAPSAPAPQQLGPPQPTLFGHTVPSPSSMLNATPNHATPPPNASRPGSSANQNPTDLGNNMTVSGALTAANRNYAFSAPPPDAYDLDGVFDFGRVSKEEDMPITDLDFDQYFMSEFMTTAVTGLEDDVTAAAGGSI